MWRKFGSWQRDLFKEGSGGFELLQTVVAFTGRTIALGAAGDIDHASGTNRELSAIPKAFSTAFFADLNAAGAALGNSRRANLRSPAPPIAQGKEPPFSK